MKLKDYVTLITGVGPDSGMGHGFAEAFAREGSHLVLNYFGQDEEKMKIFAEHIHEETGREVLLFEGDVSDESVVIRMVEETVQNLKKVDVLINAAGISHQALLKDMELSDWNRMIQVDLTSVFLACRYVVPVMLKQGFGRIINIASQVGHKGAAECCHYAAAKSGIHGFTRSLARELGEYGITVNCISPGPIKTRMLAETNEAWVRRKKSELVIPRFGEVEEVVPTAILLAAVPDGNIYTGQSLGPNCGDVML